MKKILPFLLLNSIQFFAAINENLFKLLAAYFVISLLGTEHTSAIMGKIGAIFILPFLLFSSLGGIFADRWPKNQIIIVTRLFELICLLVALVLFGMDLSYSAYVILFLMASLSALFGPSKYGMIPEVTLPNKLLYANSVIAAFTYIGIIIGTTLASVVVWLTSGNYVLALLSSIFFAAMGLFLSFLLPRTPIENKVESICFFIYIELWEGLKQMWQIPSLFTAAFAYSYFLFIGGFVQLNVIPYTIEILHSSDIVGGYLFLTTAFGLGIGAFISNKLTHGKIRLDVVPIAGIGISVILCLLKWLFIPFWLVVIWMFIIGLLGGIFLVPPQACILYKSPKEHRGRNFATANFFSFVFALLASFAIYVLNTRLELTPASSFFAVGLLNFVVMLVLLKKTFSHKSNDT